MDFQCSQPPHKQMCSRSTLLLTAPGNSPPLRILAPQKTWSNLRLRPRGLLDASYWVLVRSERGKLSEFFNCRNDGGTTALSPHSVPGSSWKGGKPGRTCAFPGRGFPKGGHAGDPPPRVGTSPPVPANSPPSYNGENSPASL